MLVTVIIVTTLVGVSDALQCASCSNITNVNGCQNYVTCAPGEKCYSTSFGIGSETLFDLGCTPEGNCFSSPGISVIGRSVSNVQCSQCCAVDKCNEHLCSAGTQITNEVGNCADDPNYDCKQFSTLFNICADVVHAKTACRQWCGLCNLVDGAWSVWTSWSNCDVTCGTGHVTRSRSCTDPPPAHGGLTCSGNTTEVNTCTLDPCPIHGGWSSWKTWSPCSNTCGIGTQSRHRLCNNPKPAIAGNHCFGEVAEYQACFERSCTDGGWSTWSSWSGCADYMKSRNRSCDNPAPSQFGRYCMGSNTDKKICNIITSGSGGTGGHIAFTVNTPNGKYSTGNTLIFANEVVNLGGGFDLSTGRFTCTTPGLYHFELALIIDGSSRVSCFIRKNSHVITYAAGYGTSTFNAISTSTYLQLSVGDVVDVGDCYNYQYIDPGTASTFSGALVQPITKPHILDCLKEYKMQQN